MDTEKMLELAFEFLDNNKREQAKKFFQAVLEEDATNGDAAFGLLLCLEDSNDFEFDELVKLLQIVTESDSVFKDQAQEVLDNIISPNDLDLFNKLDALVNKAAEFDEIFDALQKSSGELQDRLIENRANEMLEEFQNIAESFSDYDIYKIQRASSEEIFDKF